MLEDEHGGTVHAPCFANAVGHFHEASGAASARARRINLLTCALMRRRRPEGSDWLGCNQWAPLSWSARSTRFGSFMARSVLFRPSFRSVIAREQLGKLDDAPPHGGVLDRSERSGEGEPVRAREEVRALRISALSSSSERPSNHRHYGTRGLPGAASRPRRWTSQSAPEHPSEQRRAGSVDGLSRCR